MSGLHISTQKNFTIVRWTLALVVLAVAAAYAYFGIRWYNTGELSPLPLPVSATDTSIDESAITQEQIVMHDVPADQPRYIEIPKLNVSQTRVQRVGLTDRNILDVPKNINDTGWYVKSSTPGSGVGAVLIDGHNSGLHRSGVFAKLASLQKGDQISIERGDGKVFSYAVYDVREMPLEQVNRTGMKEMMYSAKPDKEGLSLITSSGKWVPKEKIFDHRILVRAIIVD